MRVRAPWRNNRIAVVDPDTVQDGFVAARHRGRNNRGPHGNLPASADPTHHEFSPCDRRGPRCPASCRAATDQPPARRGDVTGRGQSYNYCRIFITASEYDYVVAPERSRPFATITLRPRRAALATAIRDWQDTPPRTTQPPGAAARLNRTTGARTCGHRPCRHHRRHRRPR
jgi:hypothetical protein